MAIVVLNWNGYDVSRRCLVSLQKATYSPRTIYLVDNASIDDSAPRLEAEWKDRIVFIRNQTNLGFAAGCNRGLARARSDGADYFLLLNNDCVVHEPAFLDHAVETAERDLSCGIVGGKIVLWPDTGRIWCTGGQIGWSREHYIGMGESDEGQYDSPATREFISGALMLIRRSVIDDIGLLPEQYFFGHEDWEFSVRAHRRGYRLLYDPRFTVAHEAGSSHESVSPVYLYNDTLGKILFKKRNLPPWQFWIWITLYAVYLVGLFPIKRSLQRHLYLKGVDARVLRSTMIQALRDSRGLERVTPEMLERFRALQRA